MKILFLGDYSNLHACLARELNRRGHTAHVISDRGTYMNTHADTTLRREPGFIGSWKYLFKCMEILPELKGYDVVQLINPNFLSLTPGKIKYFFEKIRLNNGRVFLTLAGNDQRFVKECNDARMFRFSEFKVGDKPTQFLQDSPEELYGWLSTANRRWCDYLTEHLDGAMSVLPEYDMAWRPVLGDKVTFTNIPIDLYDLPYSPIEIEGPVKIFIGMSTGREIQKGTADLLTIARQLEREMPGKVAVESVRNLPLDEYLWRMRSCDIVLDQLYSYSPATNALQAMAFGRVVGSGAEPEYYQYLKMDGENGPIFQLSPLVGDLKGKLAELVMDTPRLERMSVEGRRLVEQHNDVKIVADRFLSAWK